MDISSMHIYEESAGVVVFDAKEGQRLYLLLHYVAGHWDFAKGHCEANETKKETALRELQEEAGITAIILPGFDHSFSYVYTHKDGSLREKKVIFFVGKAQYNPVVRLSHEHIGFAWLPYDLAHERLTYQNARNLLTIVDQWLDVNPSL